VAPKVADDGLDLGYGKMGKQTGSLSDERKAVGELMHGAPP